MMNSDQILLENICQTADMGKSSLNQVMNLTDNTALQNTLKTQMNGYEKCYMEAGNLLRTQGKQPKKANPAAKASAKISSSAKTWTSTEPTAKVAEMVIQGGTMGITQMTKALHDCTGCSPQVSSMAQNYIQQQQANIEEIKPFL